MVVSDSFAEFLREQLAPLSRTTLRQMFGKTGVFCSGAMFAVGADDRHDFRVDGQNRVACREAQTFPTLSYE